MRTSLAVVLFAAFLLRVEGIRQPFIDAFSWREASTAMIAESFFRDSWNIFYPRVRWTGPEPGYQGREFQTVAWLTAILYTVFGQHEWVARGVVVAFGLAGILALYQLTRQVWGERHALAAAAMMAVLPGAVFVDRSFLPDPAMVALVTTFCWLFVAYLRTDRTRILVGAVIAGMLGFATKLPGLIVGLPASYAAVAILRRRGAWSGRRILGLGAVAVGMLVPVAAYYLWAWHLAISYPPHHFAGGRNWLWNDGPARWLAQDYFLPESWRHVRWWMYGRFTIALVAIGLLFPPPQKTEPGVAPTAPWFFHAWLVGCVVYYLIGARELAENPWNFHLFDPVAAAFAGRALVSIAAFVEGRARPAFAMMAVVVILGGVVVTGRSRIENMRKGWSRETYLMGQALRRLGSGDDLVVTIANDVGDPIGIYYAGRRGWVFPQSDRPEVWRPWNLMPDDDETAIALFEELRSRGADWLGIATGARDDRPEPHDLFWPNHRTFVEHIERTCELVEKTEHFVIYRIRSFEELTRAGISSPRPVSSASADDRPRSPACRPS